MRWHNAQTEAPRNLQYVLISVNGMYYDAVYDSLTDSYTARRFQKIVFSPDRHVIYWCTVLPPYEAENIPED